jgi:hypothetical protein
VLPEESGAAGDVHGGEGVEEPVVDGGAVGLVVAFGVVGLGSQRGSELDGGLVVAAAFADRLVDAATIAPSRRRRRSNSATMLGSAPRQRS